MSLLDSKIKIYNEQHNEAVQKRLFELGYSWKEGKKFMYKKAKSLYINDEGVLSYSTLGCMHSFEIDVRNEITLTDLYLNKRDSVKLTEDYTAFVKDGFVKVGCQEIPFEKIDELHNLIHS